MLEVGTGNNIPVQNAVAQRTAWLLAHPGSMISRTLGRRSLRPRASAYARLPLPTKIGFRRRKATVCAQDCNHKEHSVTVGSHRTRHIWIHEIAHEQGLKINR